MQANPGDQQVFTQLRSLNTCLEIYHKALTFDFIAILLNETLDEPSSTNLPSSWVTKVEDPGTLDTLFGVSHSSLGILNDLMTNQQLSQRSNCQSTVNDIVFLSFKCLGEYANLRATLFTDKQTKNLFTVRFLNNLC